MIAKFAKEAYRLQDNRKITMQNTEHNFYIPPRVRVVDLQLENYAASVPDRADNGYEDNELGEI